MATRVYLQNRASAVDYTSQLETLYASAGGASVGLTAGPEQLGVSVETTTTMSATAPAYRPFYCVTPQLLSGLALDYSDVSFVVGAGTSEDTAFSVSVWLYRITGGVVVGPPPMYRLDVGAGAPYTPSGVSSGGSGSGSLILAAGDRLLLEFRYTYASGSSRTLRTYYGGTGTDLAFRSSTVTNPGWVEFVPTITFAPESATLTGFFF